MDKIVDVIRNIYGFFENKLPNLFQFVKYALPDLDAAAEWVKWLVLAVGLGFTAFVLIFSIVGIFKGCFFRRLSRGVLIFETLGAAGLVLISLRLREEFTDNVVKALKVGSKQVYDLIGKVWKDFGAADKMLASFIVIAALFVITMVIFHIIIVVSKKIARSAYAEEEPEEEEVPEAIPEVAQTVEVPEEKKEEAKGSAPILPASVPECEIENIIDADATPNVEAEPEEVEEENETESENGENVSDEETENEGENEAGEFTPAEKPAFMPIPGSLFDLTDFTVPARDGFSAVPGATPDEAEALMTSELTEDLTTVIYESAHGEMVDVALGLLEANFVPGSYIDAKVLRRKGLIPETASRIRITAKGTVTKAFMIKANEFDGASASMIILACGRPVLAQ